MDDSDKNPFKALEANPKPVPETLKKRVMSEIATARLAKDLVGLFTQHYGQAMADPFKPNPETNK